MLAQYLGLGALALGLANAWTYPDCQPDNCYRNLVDPRFTTEVGPFCMGYLDGDITTVASDFSNCDSTAASSACSCIVYTMTHTSSASSTSTSVPVTTTTTSSSSVATTSSSSSSSSYSSSSSSTYSTAPMTSTSSSSVASSTSTITSTSTSTPISTTSTVYTTKIYTVTSCATTVTNCPVGKVTTTVSSYTTICPVTSSNGTYVPPPMTTPGTIYTPTKSIGTVTVPKSSPTTSLPLQVTAAAGKLERSLELAVAGAAVVAAFL